jgi:hypothetical protein
MSPVAKNFAGKCLMTLVLATAAFCFINARTLFAADGDEKMMLNITLPQPTLKGTPEDLPKSDTVEAVPDKAPTLEVPKGVVNVALGKPVTSSVPPFTGDLKQITDGSKEATDNDAVEFKKGPQWVQVDLGESLPIYAIAIWHDHRYIQVMHAVVVQVSDDPEFKTGVSTVYNNDRENKAGLGAGTDKEYFETRFGKLIDAKGVKARYVRGYTRGSTQGALNVWQEIEVYAKPSK